MVFGRKRLDNVYFVSSCPGNPPVVSVRFSHQFRESLLKAVFSRLYGGHFRPEKTELHRGLLSFYTKSPRSEKSEKFREVVVSRPSSFAPESSITTNPLAHAVDNPSPIKPPLDR